MNKKEESVKKSNKKGGGKINAKTGKKEKERKEGRLGTEKRNINKSVRRERERESIWKMMV